jgi:cellulose biosynthesis protein BcsQ
MLIDVANLNDGRPRSTCAVNLACELADLDNLTGDRWQGKRRVVLFDADPNKGTETRYGYGGHLPVSHDCMPLGDSTIESWVGRLLSVAAEVDYVVVDSPPEFDSVTEAIVEISDLVIVPCSSAGADMLAASSVMDLLTRARTRRSDGGPKCLLVPTLTNPRTAGREPGFDLRKFGEPVGPAILERSTFEDAFAGRWIGDFAHFSPAHLAITTLAAAVERLLGR